MNSRRPFSSTSTKVGYYIDGQEKFGEGDPFVSKNPATDEEIAVVHSIDFWHWILAISH